MRRRRAICWGFRRWPGQRWNERRQAQPFMGFTERVLRVAGGVCDGGPAFCAEIRIDAGKDDQPARQGEGGSIRRRVAAPVPVEPAMMTGCLGGFAAQRVARASAAARRRACASVTCSSARNFGQACMTMSRKLAETRAVLGEVGREFVRESPKLVPVDAADERGLVDQRWRVHRLRKEAMMGACRSPCFRQNWMSLARAPRRRAAERAGGRSSASGPKAAGAIFLFDVAKGVHVGRQQRAADGAMSWRARLARGALVGREDQGVGEGFGIFARVGGVDEAARKFVEEGGGGRKGEDLRRAFREDSSDFWFARQLSGPIVLRRASASSRPAGSPTCIQKGDMTVP